MAEPQLPDEMLAGLRDIRLPEIAQGGTVAEIAAAVGLGLLIGCVLSFLIPLISRSTRGNKSDAQDRLSDILKLSEPARSVALLHLIRRRNPKATEGLRDRLYRRDAFPTAHELEQLAQQIEANPNA